MSRQVPDASIDALSLTEVLSSLSFALDLTSGQPMGHAQATCLIGMKIAGLLGLPDSMQASLYHALLIKDSGCSSNAGRMYEIFGSDERVAKRDSKVTDWTNLFEAAKYAAAHALPQARLVDRARRILKLAVNQVEISTGILQTRCNRGAEIALTIGLGADAAECIRSLDEHWNGHGQPVGLKGEQIPVLGRIACLAQTMDVFARTFGVDAAYDIAAKRSGKWFDPELVKIACSFQHDMEFWGSAIQNPRQALLSIEARSSIESATHQRIDTVCTVFAQIVDAKSPFTAEHSKRVTDYAVELGEAFGYTPERLSDLRRAAWLHDIGKLGVPNTILDKNGKPTDDEWATIRLHPMYTQQILAKISGFERISEIAAAHHERLDGKGYFRGLTAEHLDLDMRILAVADVYDALSADRPYRGAMTSAEVFAILERDAGVALDAMCIDMLKQLHGNVTLATLKTQPLPIAMAA